MSEKNKRDDNSIAKSSFFDNQVEQENLEFARFFKKYLRFEIGDIVFLKSDSKRKCPMSVSGFFIHDADHDYVCSWATSQKDIKRAFFKDKELTQ